MDTKIYYIVPDSTFRPIANAFRIYKVDGCVPVWKNKDNAFKYLNEKINCDYFGIVHSTENLLRSKYKNFDPQHELDIKFMD